MQASPGRTWGEQGQAEVCEPELAELSSLETREGGAHRGDFIPGARAGPSHPRKLRSGDPGGRFPWQFVSESRGKLSLCGSRGGESYGLTRAGAGGTVSVVRRPIFHGKVNKANGICLCLEPSPEGAPHPQAASHWAHCPWYLGVCECSAPDHGLSLGSLQPPAAPPQALPELASPGRCSQISSIAGILAAGTQGLVQPPTCPRPWARHPR